MALVHSTTTHLDARTNDTTNVTRPRHTKEHYNNAVNVQMCT